MELYLGLDVHSKTISHCLMDKEGKIIDQGQIATTVRALAELIEKRQIPVGTKIGLESGEMAYWTTRVLFELEMEPIVIHAFEVRQKARRQNQKSDKRDAFEICDGLRRGIYSSIVYMPKPAIEALREILSRRRHFVRTATQQINAAKHLVRAHGKRQLVRSLSTAVAWDRLLKNPDVASLHGHIEMHYNVWKVCQELIRKLEAELKVALVPFTKEMELLMSVPGVGVITASTFLAVVGNPNRFANSSRLVSYTGLAPSTYSSGDKDVHGRITKRGSCELRAMLCEAAHQAARIENPMHPYFVRACAKSGYKKALIAVAHRLARILYQIWKTGRPFDVGRLKNIVQIDGERVKKVQFVMKDEAKKIRVSKKNAA